MTRRVIFLIVNSGALVVYPDDIEYFSNTEDLGNGYMTADYSGSDDTIQDYSPITDIVVHLDISGGDGETIPGIENDGIEFVKILVECKLPDGSAAPLPDGNYRIIIRDGDDSEYDLISVPFISGSSLFDYSCDLKPATAHIDVSDLGVPGFELNFIILGDNLIKIYRSL